MEKRLVNCAASHSQGKRLILIATRAKVELCRHISLDYFGLSINYQPAKVSNTFLLLNASDVFLGHFHTKCFKCFW